MAMTGGDARGGFGSRLGFVLAAAGSAVGLGNIWRFPYLTGENGGAAFILLYLLSIFLFCAPVLFCELAIGRATQQSPVGAFSKLAPGTLWYLTGALGVVAGFAILSFYAVVAGWTLGYFGKALLGAFADPMDAETSGQIFSTMIGSGPLTTGLALAFLVMTALVVRGGVSAGIERASKILMPILAILLVAMAVRSVTLPGAGAGVEYLLKPDFSKITIQTVMSALGQALFSLSLGMGAMITYGSYLGREERLPGAGIAVAFSDTGVALLAGFMIFPALFAMGLDPSGGPGLVFVVLPTIFGKLPAGFLVAIMFYGLLVIAALTSTVSLLEVVVAYFVDRRGWKRERATWIVTFVCFLLAVPSALSTDFLDWQSILFGNYALAIGALLICVFVGWRWGIPAALEEIARGGQRLPAGWLFGVLVRYVCPAGVAAIIVYSLVTGQTF